MWLLSAPIHIFEPPGTMLAVQVTVPSLANQTRPASQLRHPQRIIQPSAEAHIESARTFISTPLLENEAAALPTRPPNKAYTSAVFTKAAAKEAWAGRNGQNGYLLSVAAPHARWFDLQTEARCPLGQARGKCVPMACLQVDNKPKPANGIRRRERTVEDKSRNATQRAQAASPRGREPVSLPRQESRKPY